MLETKKLTLTSPPINPSKSLTSFYERPLMFGNRTYLAKNLIKTHFRNSICSHVFSSSNTESHKWSVSKRSWLELIVWHFSHPSSNLSTEARLKVTTIINIQQHTLSALRQTYYNIRFSYNFFRWFYFTILYSAQLTYTRKSAIYLNNTLLNALMLQWYIW